MSSNDPFDIPPENKHPTQMKVQGPSKKLQAVNEALAKLPPTQRTIEEVRQQVIEHHLESQQELMKSTTTFDKANSQAPKTHH